MKTVDRLVLEGEKELVECLIATQLPKDAWGGKIRIPDCTPGIVKAVYNVLKELGYDNRSIRHKLILQADYRGQFTAINNDCPEIPYTKDDGTMDVDTIITNPNYDKRGWKKDIEKHYPRARKYILGIHPDPTAKRTTMGEEVRSLYNKFGIQKKEDCTDDFPTVDSGTISWFFCDVRSQPVADVFSPKTAAEKLLHKVLSRKDEGDGAFVLRGSQNQYKEHLSLVPEGKYTKKLIIKQGKGDGMVVVYGDPKVFKAGPKYKERLKGRHFVINRHFGLNNDEPITLVEKIEEYDIGYNILVMKAFPGETVENFRSAYCSDLYRGLLGTLRGAHKDIKQSELQSLPRPKLTKRWTDKSLRTWLKL